MIYENEAERERKLLAVVELTAVLAVVIVAKELSHHLHGSFAFYEDEEVEIYEKMAQEQNLLNLTVFFEGDQPHCA
jgi:hypothetical protein